MNFDEDTPFGEMAIKLAQEADKEHPEVSYSIEQYLLEKMDLTSQGLSSEETNLLCKNFIHLMCTVIDDLKLQIASLNGHLCHIWRPACDLNGGQPRTH